MLEIGFLVVAVYGLMLVTAAAFQRRMMYFPDRSVPEPSQFGVADMAPAALETEDGLTLTAWYKAAPGREGPVLVYFHGNAGHIGYRGEKVRPFLDRGFGVLLVSYRGYGGNPGSPMEQGLYRDGRAALNWLAAQGVAANRMVLYGESLGSGVAVRLAAEMPRDQSVGALVLEAPYTSTVDVAARAYPIFPVRLLMRDRFDSLSIIDQVGAPLFVVHGERDSIIPARLGRDLLAAAREPKRGVFLEAAGHNDLHEHGSAKTVMDFLAERGLTGA